MRKNAPYLYAHLIIVLLAVFITSAKAVTITSLTQNADTIGRFNKFEITFTLSQTYSNPFDPCVIDINVSFSQPDGNIVTIPAFFYKSYTVSGSNPETYTTAGATSWKARFAPSQLGTHSFDITIKDPNGTVVYPDANTFVCQENVRKGFIKIDPNNHNFLKYDNGDTRINIGENIGWNNGSVPGGGIAGWDYYLKKLHNAGANWVRLWSCHYGSDMGVALEWKQGLWGTTYFQGAGKPSLQTSLRMDKYVEIAEQNDIAIQFCLQHHGQFSTNVNPDWNDNPYNSINPGGFLSDPALYFTDANAIKLTKNKYRYIVARWGYSPAIFAWELFNEVQFTNAGLVGDPNVVNWHNTMASYIRSIDKFKHPVTTSSYDPSRNLGGLWTVPDINIIEVHYYGNDTIHSIEQQTFNLGDKNKPIIMAEFGLGGNPEGSTQPEPYATQLKEGLEMHNGMWTAFHIKSSAHLWWWDNYIDPCNLYPLYTALKVYANNEHLADFNLGIAQRAVSGAISLYANPEIWDYYAMPTQTVFYLQGDCFPGMDKLNQYLHGNWDNSRRTDPNYHLNMPTAGALKIHVESTAGGNSGTRILQVLVNGTQVFSSSYSRGATNFIVTVSLSAGQQNVQVKNGGDGWFHITSYEFAPTTSALLNSIGLSNNERAYIWIYDVNSQYGLTNNGTFHNEPVIVKGLADGSYFVEVYATRGAGGVIASGLATSTSGVLTYTLPDFTKDIAVKVRPACTIDLYGLADFCAQWTQSGLGVQSDIAGGNSVDFGDFNFLAGNWLGQCPPGWPF